jgi:hypothetical protein
VNLADFHSFKWSDQTTWPDDADGHIFLARVIDRVGRRLFADWTGDEQCADHIPKPLSAVLDRFVDDFDRGDAYELLLQSGEFPDLPPTFVYRSTNREIPEGFVGLSDRRLRQLGYSPCPQQTPSSEPKSNPTTVFTDEQWAAAVQLREQKRRAVSERQGRFIAAKKEVSKILAEGSIGISLKTEGAVQPSLSLDAGVWNIKHQDAFVRCTLTIDMNPNPYRDPDYPREFWVYVDQAGLHNWSMAGSTAADERAAEKSLASLLKLNNDLTLSEAIEHCQQRHGISGRGVVSRVWPNARQLAGLPAKARAGRKPKSAR